MARVIDLADHFETWGVEFIGGPWDGQRSVAMGLPERIEATEGPRIEPPNQSRPPAQKFYRWDGDRYVLDRQEGDKP